MLVPALIAITTTSLAPPVLFVVMEWFIDSVAMPEVPHGLPPVLQAAAESPKL